MQKPNINAPVGRAISQKSHHGQRGRTRIVEPDHQQIFVACHPGLNPATTLAFLRLLYPTLIDMSTALHMDAAPRRQWRNVLDHLSPSSFYPAAACAGYDPASILDHAHLMVTHFAKPNFGYSFGGGGVENFSTVPSMLCAMFMQSYQQNIHLFPDWPLNEDARFGHLLACGNFLISGAISNGQVLYVQVHSNSGELLRLANPWPSKAVLVNTGGANSQTVSGAVLTLPTTVAETLLLTPAAK
jgi:hypothetical protein